MSIPWQSPRFLDLLAQAAEGRGPDQCHPWPGNVTVYGYGRFGQVHAHRLVLFSAGVEIPEGHEPDHTCHTREAACEGGKTCPHRRCVNLAHLDVVTARTNWERGRAPSRRNADRTCCGTCGRPYDMVSNTVRDGVVRRCSTCTYASNRRSAGSR